MILKASMAKSQVIFPIYIWISGQCQIAINAIVTIDGIVQLFLNAYSQFLHSHPRTVLVHTV